MTLPPSWIPIIQSVCRRRRIGWRDVISRSRLPPIVAARHEIWWALHRQLAANYTELGRCIGGFDRATVAHGIERWEAKRREEGRNVTEFNTYQDRVRDWLVLCFGEGIATDVRERNYRFLEEAIELVQARGCTEAEAHQLVSYVFGRPYGDPEQEVGGVLVTLAALCSAAELRMDHCGEIELERINQPEMISKIRAKHATKPVRSPLPGSGDISEGRG